MKLTILVSFLMFLCAGCSSKTSDSGGGDAGGTPVGEVTPTPSPAPEATPTPVPEPPTVVSLIPVAGNVLSIPSTVTVTFSKVMNSASVENISNWSIDCQSGTVSVQSVGLAGNVATITLNSSIQPDDGHACEIAVTTNVLDSDNNPIGGLVTARQVVYTKVSAATVINVTSTKNNGYYKTGETINISVTFSEVVNVTGGIPQITLETGTSDAVIDLTTGSGTTTLQGTYTVGASDTSSDLNYASTSALVANGAQIKNASNVEATLTLPGLANAGSLATNKAIVIDTTAPTAPSSVDDLTWKNSTSVSPAITFSGSSDGGSGINHHEAQVVLGSNTSTVLASWQTFTTGSTILGLALTNGTQYKVQVRAVDRAGNTSTTFTSDGWTVDTTAPSVPTSVTLGPVPSNATDTPTITYTAGTDGGSGIASHQVKIIKTSGGAVAKDWAVHTSGTAITGITPDLEDGAQYSILVRSVDNVGNVSSQTSAVNWMAYSDTCNGSPSAGTVCSGGAIFAGTLSPGATSGSGIDKYMTTPGGCGEIPAEQIVGSGASAYTNADFTPTCSGTDALTKNWNDGTTNWYDILGLTNKTDPTGTGNGASNTDQYYGSDNTTNIVAITSAGQGGYHAAARYCDKLVYGGYSDWYLPNRYELNLLYTNKASIPGLDISTNYMNYYWSSTEYDNTSAWVQHFNDGDQGNGGKNNSFRLRCVRRY